MVKRAKIALQVGQKTDQGKVRTENQDRLGGGTTPLGDFYIVADGMGGHKGGATAAAMTVDGFLSSLQVPPEQTTPGEALMEAAKHANESTYQAANSGNPETHKMGSTAVMLLFAGRDAWVAHVGDSRAYLLRKGHLQKLTRDHSLVQKLIDGGLLAPEQARNHPHASVLTQAVGTEQTVQLEVGQPMEVQPGDAFLLCSDGLWAFVPEPDILRVINEIDDPQAVADQLVSLALEAGGRDNVSVQFIRCARAKRKVLQSQLTRTLLFGSLLGMVALGFALKRPQHAVAPVNAQAAVGAGAGSGEARPAVAAAVPETVTPVRPAATEPPAAIPSAAATPAAPSSESTPARPAPASAQQGTIYVMWNPAHRTEQEAVALSKKLASQVLGAEVKRVPPNQVAHFKQLPRHNHLYWAPAAAGPADQVWRTLNHADSMWGTRSEMTTELAKEFPSASVLVYLNEP